MLQVVGVILAPLLWVVRAGSEPRLAAPLAWLALVAAASAQRGCSRGRLGGLQGVPAGLRGGLLRGVVELTRATELAGARSQEELRASRSKS